MQSQLTEKISPTERLVADTVRRFGPMARASLPGQTGLSQATVHRAIDRLEEAQIIELGESAANGPGKPSPMVSIKGSTVCSLGLCINTDAITFALADLRGVTHATENITVDANDPQSVAKEILKRIREFLDAGSLKTEQICGIGISMPGFRDQSANSFQTPRPLSAWRGIEIDSFFRNATGLDAFVENNGACGALAELFAGHGVQDQSFGYLSFNFGFGGGIVLDGSLVRGARGNAGEIGKVFTNEQMVHRPALGELLQRLSAQGIVLDRISDLNTRFEPDWPGVNEWITEVTPYLDLAIRAITAVVDPSFIVFGGEAPPALKAMLLDACAKQFIDRWGRTFPMPTLKSSNIPGDPALLGAAFLAMKNRVFL